MADNYDVLIIGGGLVGASLVCALAPFARLQGLTMALVETHDLTKPKALPPSFDARSSALSYGTRLAYEKLGVWQALEANAAAIRQVHVSDKGHFGVTRLDHKAEGVPALGYVVDNYLLGDALLKQLESFAAEGYLHILSPAEVVEARPDEGSMTTLVRRNDDKTKQVISASLAVLADGGRSGLIEQLGIYRKTQAYGQSALVANVTVDSPHQGIAYERFGEKGPIALLPKILSSASSAEAFGQHCFGLVWTLPDEEIGHVLAMSERDFLSALQSAFGYRGGRFTRVGKRDSYPLTMSVAKEQVRPGLVVLGNAAHTLHPVAGQGYNLAIRDVMALVDNIAGSLKAGRPIGQLSRLLEYENKQMRGQKKTLAFCDGLVKLFSRSEPSVILTRNLALLGLDLGGSLKSRFTKAAMGL